jgi:hypothetical protein
MVSPILQLKNLPSRKFSALKRKAERLGISPETYVKQLIQTDLALDHKAQTSSFDELAAPFRKAFKGVSEDELDRIVNAARGPRHSKQKQ